MLEGGPTRRHASIACHTHRCHPGERRDPALTSSSRAGRTARVMGWTPAFAELTPGPGNLIPLIPALSFHAYPPPTSSHLRASSRRTAGGGGSGGLGVVPVQAVHQVPRRVNLLRVPTTLGGYGSRSSPSPPPPAAYPPAETGAPRVTVAPVAGWKVPKILIVRRGFESLTLPTTGSDDEPRLAVPFPDGTLPRTRKP
jgi:hypothetical protein